MTRRALKPIKRWYSIAIAFINVKTGKKIEYVALNSVYLLNGKTIHTKCLINGDINAQETGTTLLQSHYRKLSSRIDFQFFSQLINTEVFVYISCCLPG